MARQRNRLCASCINRLLFRITTICTEMAEPVEMLFGMSTQLDQMNRVLGWGPRSLQGKGQFGGHLPALVQYGEYQACKR